MIVCITNRSIIFNKINCENVCNDFIYSNQFKIIDDDIHKIKLFILLLNAVETFVL